MLLSLSDFLPPGLLSLLSRIHFPSASSLHPLFLLGDSSPPPPLNSGLPVQPLAAPPQPANPWTDGYVVPSGAAQPGAGLCAQTWVLPVQQVHGVWAPGESQPSSGRRPPGAGAGGSGWLAWAAAGPAHGSLEEALVPAGPGPPAAAPRGRGNKSWPPSGQELQGAAKLFVCLGSLSRSGS